MLDELALECMQDSREEILAMLAARRSRKWTGVIDTLIEQYWNQFHIPLVRELWVGQHLTPNIRTLDRLWGEELAEILLLEFGKYAPKFERLTISQCMIAVEIMERLSQYAFRDDADGDQNVKAEIRSVLHGYLATFE
ncbi:TetR/AcrR family transcriptional regulator [Mycolicibacterium setense]